jgi:hypothetical protein
MATVEITGVKAYNRMVDIEAQINFYSEQADMCLDDPDGPDDDGYEYNVKRWSELELEHESLKEASIKHMATRAMEDEQFACWEHAYESFKENYNYA